MRFRFVLPIVLVAVAGIPAHADLTINPTFDPSIAAVSGAEAAIDAAISTVESDISSPNNITVSIYFTNMTSGLGESVTGNYLPTYFQYYNAFAAVATQPDQLEALASLGAPPVSNSSGNPVNGNTGVVISSAEGRNLGFDTPGYILPNSNIDLASGGGTFDGEIGLNTSITSPPNGLAGNYGLQAVATHEIDEVLGIGGEGSTLTGTGSLTGPVGDLDLFRYSAPGVRSYSNTNTTSPFSYFSIDGGATVLSYFSQTTGADFGDWLSNPIPAGYSPQVQDAFGEPGTNPALGVNELTAFNAIGYDLIAPVPEPSTLTLLLTGVGLALGGAFIRRRRTAA